MKAGLNNSCKVDMLRRSTRALKTDSLDTDPRSGFNVVARELHTARRLRELHCLTGSHALSRRTARSSDPDRGRVEDPRAPSSKLCQQWKRKGIQTIGKIISLCRA